MHLAVLLSVLFDDSGDFVHLVNWVAQCCVVLDHIALIDVLLAPYRPAREDLLESGERRTVNRRLVKSIPVIVRRIDRLRR